MTIFHPDGHVFIRAKSFKRLMVINEIMGQKYRGLDIYDRSSSEVNAYEGVTQKSMYFNSNHLSNCSTEPNTLFEKRDFHLKFNDVADNSYESEKQRDTCEFHAGKCKCTSHIKPPIVQRTPTLVELLSDLSFETKPKESKSKPTLVDMLSDLSFEPKPKEHKNQVKPKRIEKKNTLVELLSDLSFEKKVEKPKPTLAELLSDLSFESKPSIKSVDPTNEQVMVNEPKQHETNSCLTKAQKRTDETVQLYESLGRPSVKSFKDIVANNLTGARVTTQNINNAHLLDADGSRSAAIIRDKPNKESNSKVVSAIGELIYADIVYDD
jgi:hypothetical protein